MVTKCHLVYFIDIDRFMFLLRLFKKNFIEVFPGGPAVGAPHFYCMEVERGTRFNPWSGN